MNPLRLFIDAELKSRLPGLRLLVTWVDEAHVTPTPAALRGRIELFHEHLRLAYEDAGALERIPGVRAWRDAFRALGIDPARYRPSGEALLRRILQRKPLGWINAAVDLNNFLSIQYGIPCGIYNRDALVGDAVLRLGRAEERYLGLNGRENGCAGKPVLADAAGPFGSPIVDAERTKVTEGTHNLLHVAYLPPGFPDADVARARAEAADLFAKVTGATAIRQDVIA